MTARQEPTPVLKETEVQALYDKTNWSSWFEAQRMNFLVSSYQLGQRPESLMRLCVGNFQPKVLEGGQKSIEVNFGTIKNASCTGHSTKVWELRVFEVHRSMSASQGFTPRREGKGRKGALDNLLY